MNIVFNNWSGLVIVIVIYVSDHALAQFPTRTSYQPSNSVN